jgi:RNA polymerase sigma-70 factor (ECF subfamily)
MVKKGHDLESQLKSWLLAALNGDQDAYQNFLNRVAGIVGAYFMKSMNPRNRSPQRVEELAQDVLLSIHQKRATYQTSMPVLPWVYAIARYRLIDAVRRDARRPRFANWEEGYEDLLWTEAQQGGAASSDQQVEALLEGLGDRQKEIMVLAKVEEVPLSDIAEKFEMSLSAVKVTVHRAVKTMRKRQLEKAGGLHEDK